MTDLAVSSLAYGANVRSAASFGNNIIGFLPEAAPVKQTGPQQGDRWIPCRGELNGATRDMFISKNVLRPRVAEAKERLVRAAEAMRNRCTPMSARRATALGASFVCRVERTR